MTDEAPLTLGRGSVDPSAEIKRELHRIERRMKFEFAAIREQLERIERRADGCFERLGRLERRR